VEIAAGAEDVGVVALTASVAEDVVSTTSTHGPQWDDVAGIVMADTGYSAISSTFPQPSDPTTSMATCPSPPKHRTTPSSTPAKPRVSSIAVSARKRAAESLTRQILTGN
jgi:hypothetical protein